LARHGLGIAVWRRPTQGLIDEALAGSPSIDKARARIAAAVAFSESANANTLPQVGAGIPGLASD
jgi:outer membrane protein TolC